MIDADRVRNPACDPILSTGLGGGFLRPGRSSEEGGIEEFPLSRPTTRSRAVTRSTSPVFAALSSSIALACAAITTSQDTRESHPRAGGSGSVTTP